MKNAATGKPALVSQTDWNRVKVMQDDEIVFDADSPRTQPGDWDDAIVSHSPGELRAKLAERRTRGPNKRPTKEQVAIRLSPEVLAYFRASGNGWQTRMDEALREYVKEHLPA